MSAFATPFVMIVASFFWGFNFPLVHQVVASVPPMEAVFARFGLAAVVLAGVAMMQGHGLPIFKHGLKLGVLGLLGVVAFNLLFFFAMKNTSAVDASLIMGTNPLVTVLLAAVFLGETPQRRHMIALPFAFIGVAVVVLGNGGTVKFSAGDMMMIAANLSWATYNILAKRWMPRDAAPIANTAVIMIYSSIFLGGATLATDTAFVMPDFVTALEIVIVGLGGTVVAYQCYNHGIAVLGAGKAALFMNLVPVWAMVTSMGMGVTPTAIQFAGGLVVISSVVYATMPRRMASPKRVASV